MNHFVAIETAAAALVPGVWGHAVFAGAMSDKTTVKKLRAAGYKIKRFAYLLTGITAPIPACLK